MYLLLVQILEVATALEWDLLFEHRLIRIWSENWHGGRADLLLILLTRVGIIRILILRLI